MFQGWEQLLLILLLTVVYFENAVRIRCIRFIIATNRAFPVVAAQRRTYTEWPAFGCHVCRVVVHIPPAICFWSISEIYPGFL